jgi:alkane 1-monooxygenase
MPVGKTVTFVKPKEGDLGVRSTWKEKLIVPVAFLLLNIFADNVFKRFHRNENIPLDPIASQISPRVIEVVLFVIPLIVVLIAKHDWASPYAIAYIIPLITWWNATRGIFWMIPLLIFVIIPLLELACGADGVNPTRAEQEELNNRPVFRYITMLWAPTQVLFLIWACWAASFWPLTWYEFAMFAFSVGANTGVLGINIAHELIHKNNELEQTLGKILLVTVCYGHFFVEHIWGHHKNVSTPHDPASSRFNETFYAFYPRTVIGSFRSGLHIEAETLKKNKKQWWSIHNRMLQFVFGSLFCALAAFVAFGPRGLLMFVCQSVVAFSFLEVVNYIEHYGLERRIYNTKSKSYEPVNILHSWNSDARITNFFLFKLHRHSDHHAFASRRYQILRSFEESPQMPSGYAGMITLALFPPLWFFVMNDRVKKFQERLAATVDLNKVDTTKPQEVPN